MILLLIITSMLKDNFSAKTLVFVCLAIFILSLPFPNLVGSPVCGSPTWRLYGSAKGDLLQEDWCQHTAPPKTAVVRAPTPRWAAVDPHVRRRPPNPHRQVCSVSGGAAAPLLWVLGAQGVLVPSRSLCFPQSCGSSVIKSRWPSKSDSLGIPSPFAGFPRLGNAGPDVGPIIPKKVLALLQRFLAPLLLD